MKPLADNGIGDVGVESMVEALGENTNIIALQLSKVCAIPKAITKSETQEQQHSQE